MVNRLIPPIRESRDHSLCPQAAPIALVEYGSYVCRFCRGANERVAILWGSEPAREARASTATQA